MIHAERIENRNRKQDDAELGLIQIVTSEAIAYQTRFEYNLYRLAPGMGAACLALNTTTVSALSKCHAVVYAEVTASMSSPAVCTP